MTTQKVLAGPRIGYYYERPIWAWFCDPDGTVWDFRHAVNPCNVELADLADDEVVMAPGLVYRRREFGRVT